MITKLDLRTPWPRRAEQKTWERGANLLSVQPPVLCAECNNAWMSALEDAGAPVVASMIKGDFDRDLDIATQRAVSEWALAAAIVRGEVAPDLRPITRDLARAFRTKGIDGLPVVIAAANLGHRELEATGPVATSFFHDLDGGVNGHVVLFWFRDVVVVVATEGFAQHVGDGLRVIRGATAQMWPPLNGQSWPPTRSVSDRVLLRAVQLPIDEMPRQSFDFSALGRGRRTIDAFVLPNVVGAGPFHAAAHEVAARRLADVMRPSADSRTDG